MTERTSPADALHLDLAIETDRIVEALRDAVEGLRRRGAVIGLSGGVDSSLTVALCARAFGADRVVGVLMPEKESSPDSSDLAHVVAERFGVQTVVEDITAILEAAGSYARRNSAIRSLVPRFDDDWRSKVVLPSLIDDGGLRVPVLVVEEPDGTRHKVRLTAVAYREIVAATNFKQRTRKMLEYFHADRLDYAVVGTPNRLEDDQGFFVKNGDGSADVKPIAHLFKSQVMELAKHLGVPSEVLDRTPTTDTYSLTQDQEEFFFSLPLEMVDFCLLAVDRSLDPGAVAERLGLTKPQVERIYDDIARKRRHARYLKAPPILLNDRTAQPDAARRAGG